jgi:ferrous iron transport protein B
MMSPFMSCGARLAIFTIFAAAFFPTNGHNIVFLLYVIGIGMAILTGILLKKTLLMGETTPFLLDMPDHQWPHWQSLLHHTWHRLRKFLLGAGKLILPVCIIVGTLQCMNVEGKWTQNATQETSLLSVVGKKMVPLFTPMGIDEENWPAVVGLLTGILAKEVVIGTLNTLYESPMQDTVANEDEPIYGEMIKRFGGQTKAFAYLLFVLLYSPCISATAAMAREVQRGWTLFSLCWTTGSAYTIAVIYYQYATFALHPWRSGAWMAGLFLLGLGGLGVLRYYARVYLPRRVPTPIRYI